MESYRTAASRWRHPVNIALHVNAPLGVRVTVCNAVTGFMGSWRFIILQTLVVAAWVAGNVRTVFHFDPYPFIFLNLAFSTQAAYAAPLILLASNQSAVRDRATLEHVPPARPKRATKRMMTCGLASSASRRCSSR